MTPEKLPYRPRNKYTISPKPYAELPEPLAMWRWLAEPDPFNLNHPYHLLARSLFMHGWTNISVEQVMEDTGEDLDAIRKDVNLLTGVLEINLERKTLSFIIPDGALDLPAAQHSFSSDFHLLPK